ncbi:MAG: response regulator transcription factor [Chloroflexi bacterium]|nr:response regulator transcription factor [Chloroflexota bacterium]
MSAIERPDTASSLAELRDRIRRTTASLKSQRETSRRLAERLRSLRDELRDRQPRKRRPSTPRPAGAALDRLTPRQFEVARLLALGYTNAMIADALVITSGTVANHVENILIRLDLRNRTQVAAWLHSHDSASTGRPND